MSPEPAAPARRLVRRTDDRIIGGVAAGLADLLGVDPVLVRVGFVVLAFAGGAGIVAYLALWLLTPEGTATGTRPVPDRGAAFWVAIGLFVLAGLAIADSVGDRSIVWPLVLIGAGVALWRSDGRTGRAAPGPGSPGDRAARAATAPSPAVSGSPADTAGPASPPPASPTPPQSTPPPPSTGPVWTPPPPPGAGGRSGSGAGDGGRSSGGRERSVLGRLTIGVALLAVGVLAALDRVDVLDLTVRDGLAVVLLVVGLGLVVGTWVGRARWLAIPAALLLLPALLVSTMVHDLDVPLDAGIGGRSFGTTAVADLDPVYELGVGELRLDLGDLDLDGGAAETTARVGLGQVIVVVPDDVAVEVRYRVTGGQVELFGDEVQGTRIARTVSVDGEPGAGRLDLTVEAAYGQIEVVRASDAGPFGEPDVRFGEPSVPFDGAGAGRSDRSGFVGSH